MVANAKSYKRLHTSGRAATRESLEWLTIGSEYPKAAKSLWLVDWKKMGSPRYCVYAITPDGDWPVKIGISSAPRKRLMGLQVANWKRLKVSRCWWTETRGDARDIERLIHAELSAGGKWMLGEWVDMRPEQAAEKVEWVSALNNIFSSETPPDDAIPHIEAEIARIIPWEMYNKVYGGRNIVTGLKYGIDSSFMFE